MALVPRITQSQFLSWKKPCKQHLSECLKQPPFVFFFAPYFANHLRPSIIDNVLALKYGCKQSVLWMYLYHNYFLENTDGYELRSERYQYKTGFVPLSPYKHLNNFMMVSLK